MKNKKYMVRCDMEGVSGVVSYEQVNPRAPEYPAGHAWFMADLLALLTGLRDGGAGEIVLYDEHWFGRNIDIAQLPPSVTAITGKPPYRADWAGGLDDSFAGMIMLGLHSMAGTGELLHHTYEPDIAELILNGVRVGEIGMEAAIAGDFGVPLVLITGDSAGVAEAQKLLPGVAGVAVKQSQSATGGVCLSLAESTRRIREAARQLPTNVEPFRIGATKLTVRFNVGPYRDALGKLGRLENDSLTLTGPTATAVWAEYWQLKLKAQAIQ